ncbi:AAA family ATPase [bacterium]|jgi:hypothetical protein|nr:AAA family ATPase [bacterium]
MISFDIAKSVLSKIYNYKPSENVSYKNVLKRSIFGILIPDFVIDASVIDATVDVLKYKKIYMDSLMSGDLYLPEGWHCTVDLDETVNKMENFLKYKCRGIKYLKKVYNNNKIFSEKNEKIIDGNSELNKHNYFKIANLDRKSVFTFKIKNTWCNVIFDFPALCIKYYFNEFEYTKCSDIYIDIRRLSMALARIIRNEYRKKTEIMNLLPKKFVSTLKRIESLGKLVDKYKDMRWVILVHGEPGTGKTWLFKNLPIFTDKIKLVEAYGMSNSMKEIRKKLYDKNSDNNKSLPNEIIFGTDNNKLTSGINEVGYDVFDEFDMYVGNYTTEKSIETDKSFLVNMFKEILDKTTGLVILITNHKDKIDPSVIRDGRVNEVIDFDKNFYDLEEKKNIVKYYSKQYNINDFKISNKELNNMLISSIESRCKKEMLDRGFKEIN